MHLSHSHSRSRVFEIWSFMSANFLQKLLKISKKFPRILSTFSKSRKTIIFVPVSVQNHNIDQNLAIFSMISKKTAICFIKALFFKIFGGKNLKFYVQKFPVF